MNQQHFPESKSGTAVTQKPQTHNLFRMPDISLNAGDAAADMRGELGAKLCHARSEPIAATA